MNSSKVALGRAASQILLLAALCIPAAADHDSGQGRSQDNKTTTTSEPMTTSQTTTTTESVPATPEPSALLLFMGLAGTALLTANRRTGAAT